MQAYPSRGHREHYYSVVEEEEVVEEDHMRYKDNYHHNNNGLNMHMKPNNNQWYNPQPKHDMIHKNGGYGGHNEHKYGRENYNENLSETYYEEEEYRKAWTEKNGFSGHNESSNNKHRMNNYVSGVPYDSGVHGGGYGAHHHPSYGGYECDEQRNGKSTWKFKGIVDE